MELNDLRQEIDLVDTELIRLFAKRMEVAAAIAAYKQEHNLPVADARREEQKLQAVANCAPAHLQAYTKELYTKLFALSRAYQTELSGREDA